MNHLNKIKIIKQSTQFKFIQNQKLIQKVKNNLRLNLDKMSIFKIKKYIHKNHGETIKIMNNI